MHYPIKIAAQRSGLSSQRIRMWEKRYGVLSPDRSPTNRRQFSEEDVQRLSRLAAATRGGHRIGDIANLSDTELEMLAPTGPAAATGAGEREPARVQAALQAVFELNESALREEVEKALRDLGHQGMLSRLIAPLLDGIGSEWAAGRLRAMHEHFAVATLRSILAPSKPYTPDDSAPWILCATPVEQLHEMGALLAAAVAGNQGWRVLYLGANLPAIEIIAASERVRARVVCLSIVHPGAGPELGEDLTALRRGLPDGTTILLGGRGATAENLQSATQGMVHVPDLDVLVTRLQSLWLSPLPSKYPA